MSNTLNTNYFMIRLEKLSSLLVLFFLGSSVLQAQNLFDPDHSKSFATYLLQSRQYKLAAMELERIIFTQPGNAQARKDLVFSYRMSGQFTQGIQKLQNWYSKTDPDSILAEEWVKLLLLDQSYTDAKSLLDSKGKALSSDRQVYYHLASNMLSGDWAASGVCLNSLEEYSPAVNELSLLYEKKQSLQYKSRGLALGLSALVPGLGKVYSNDWKDGLISFLFVATNAWQAYRGFSRDGVESVYGWLFGTLTLGFYGSNLYGSWKSASDYNLNLDHNLYHDIENSVYRRF